MVKNADTQENKYDVPYHYMFKRKSILNLPETLSIPLIYFDYIDRVASLIGNFHSKKILDLGCGDGRFIFESKNKGAVFFGLDSSEDAVSFAKAFNPSYKFKISDAKKKLPYDDNFFDFVVAIEFLQYFESEETKKLIKEIARILKTNGVLVLTVPHFNVKLTEKHKQHFNSNAIKSVLEPAFKIKKISGQHRKSFFKELIFYLIIMFSYISYPLKFIGFNLSGVLNKFGFNYFKKHLSVCNADNSRRLIVSAVKNL